MPTPENSLAAAYLTIYIILLPPTFYTLLHHGRHGFLGWAYLLAFCILRITGSSLQLFSSSASTQKTAETINGVGLSPLLLAILGVLHECTHYFRRLLCSPNIGAGSNGDGAGGKEGKPLLLSAVPYVIIHLVVGIALALVVVGATASPSPELGKERAGYFIFVIVWVVLVIFVVLAWKCRHVGGVRDPRVLLCTVTITLPFLLVRIVYSLAASFDSSINAKTGPIAYRVVLEALMEFVMAIGLVIAGVMTRNICKSGRPAPYTIGGVPLQQSVGGHARPSVPGVAPGTVEAGNWS